MIEVRCSHCGEVLDEPGAVVLSPPFQPDGLRQYVSKFHLCAKCYSEMSVQWLGRYR